MKEPTREIMFWGIKDPSYKITEKCCSERWYKQGQKGLLKKNSIFELCKADQKTGESLIGKTKNEVYFCLEKNGLYRYSQKK
ncbi:hypothetical protein [Rodentibacter trehalosifermentans]|uniref:hypothetical protein n=1 Tax=Rodentibacter trehalosifermentans TaxID=1908263 RepID=UPI001A95FD38|nr:hypothetical protein [Rodentibacter trehalosifermentans]